VLEHLVVPRWVDDDGGWERERSIGELRALLLLERPANAPPLTMETHNEAMWTFS